MKLKQSIKLFPKLIWDSGPFLRKFLSESESCIHEIHPKSDLKGFAATVSELCMRMSQKYSNMSILIISLFLLPSQLPQNLRYPARTIGFALSKTPAMIFYC